MLIGDLPLSCRAGAQTSNGYVCHVAYVRYVLQRAVP